MVECLPRCLVPPSLASGSEIILRPWGEGDLSIFSGVAVGKSKGKRGRSTNDVSIRGILGSVARAHELVVGGRPWDDATQVSADGVKSVVFKGLVILDNKVCSISLQSLGERSVSDGLRLEVRLREDIVSEGILSGDTGITTSGTRRDEEEDVWDTNGTDSEGTRSKKDQVHQESTFFIDVQFLTSSHLHGSNGGARSLGDLRRSEGKGRPSSQERDEE
mmetsp:Transcript_13378/g.37667  ORF Transcript_13378/g.37667 Transcript_13378/m.37667 type:complete len:219 (-) Transcript_13378:442-1098(-)